MEKGEARRSECGSSSERFVQTAGLHERYACTKIQAAKISCQTVVVRGMFQDMAGARKELWSYKETSTIEDKAKWKKARVLTKRTFNEAKRRNRREFTSTMNRNTNSSKVWETINRIRGRPPSKTQYSM